MWGSGIVFSDRKTEQYPCALEQSFYKGHLAGISKAVTGVHTRDSFPCDTFPRDTAGCMT